MWWILAGCAPGPFTRESAEAAYIAVTSVNEDVYALVWAHTDPLPEEGDTASTASFVSTKSMSWVDGEDGGSFQGTVEGPGSWTGSVVLEGNHALAPGGGAEVAYAWDMDAEYVDIGFGDATLAGTVRWEIDAAYDGGNLIHTSTISGELVGGGDAAGEGPIDTVTRVSLTGGRYVVTVTGEIGGWDVDREYDATAYAL